MFAPLFNVYHFYGQVNLQTCVCYAQVKLFTRSKFKVWWLTLFDRSLNFINFMSALVVAQCIKPINITYIWRNVTNLWTAFCLTKCR